MQEFVFLILKKNNLYQLKKLDTYLESCNHLGQFCGYDWGYVDEWTFFAQRHATA